MNRGFPSSGNHVMVGISPLVVTMSMTAGMPMPFLSLYKISVLLYSTVDNMCNVCLLSVSRIRMDLIIPHCMYVFYIVRYTYA